MERAPIAIDEGICTLCGQCVEVCLFKVLEMEDEIVNIVEPDKCNLCGHCTAVCPAGAIIAGEEGPIQLPEQKPVTPENLMVMIRSRRSTRHYKKEPVPQGVIQEIIDAGRFAPTGVNMQSIHFTVIQEPERIAAIQDRVLNNLDNTVKGYEALVEASEKDGKPIPEDLTYMVLAKDMYRSMVDTSRGGTDLIFHHAPVLMVLHTDLTGATPKDDADLMAMCMLLMAESMGLGTCLLGLLNNAAPEDDKIPELLGLPEGHRLMTSFVMGYPEYSFKKAPGRRPARINWV